jgi:hypothetical protein
MARSPTNQILTSDLLTVLLVTTTTSRLNRLNLVVHSKDGGRRIPRETTEITRGEAAVHEMEIETGRLYC